MKMKIYKIEENSNLNIKSDFLSNNNPNFLSDVMLNVWLNEIFEFTSGRKV